MLAAPVTTRVVVEVPEDEEAALVIEEDTAAAVVDFAAEVTLADEAADEATDEAGPVALAARVTPAEAQRACENWRVAIRLRKRAD
jgi:hypothetical protein